MGKFGYNTLANVSDRASYLNHLRAIRPAWMLVMDNDELANEIKNALPETHVILRHWKDDGTWTSREPEEFLSMVQREIPYHSRYWIYVDNESVNMDYYLRLIKANMALAYPINLVICNYSTGTPKRIEDWQEPEALEMLHLAAMHSDHIVVGMHYAYFMGDPTNGLQDNTLNHLNPSTWPMRPAFDPTKNNWNVHRWDWLQKFYRQAYPDAPMFRAVNTEGGPDSLDDDNSRKYIGRQLEGGWRRQAQYWQDVYHWTPDQALKICMDYINATLPDFVEGNLFFCYGTNNDPKWHYYNVEFLTDFIKAMEQANTFHASSPAAPPPVPAPVPHVQSQFYAVQASGDKMIPVYSAPLETRIAGYLTNWEIVESTNVPNGGMLDVKTDKLCGYIRTDNIILARFAPLPVDEIVKLRKLLK